MTFTLFVRFMIFILFLFCELFLIFKIKLLFPTWPTLLTTQLRLVNVELPSRTTQTCATVPKKL